MQETHKETASMPLWLFTARDKLGACSKPARPPPPPTEDYITRKDLPAEMVFGSPLLDENGDMNGTWLVLLAETKADVEAFCAGDPYSAADLFETTEIRQLAPASTGRRRSRISKTDWADRGRAPAPLQSPAPHPRTWCTAPGPCRCPAAQGSPSAPMRAPDAPSGWPSAIAPPLGLTPAPVSSMPSSRSTASP